MKHLLFFLLGLSYFSTQAQQFPQNWEGKWTGTVTIWSLTQPANSFPMSLEIVPQDSAWTFTLNYMRDENKPDLREYSLVPIVDSIGHFAIDEHNSILLDSYYDGACLYTAFGGMGSELLTRICLNGEVLEYEITSFQSEPIRVSGNQVVESDTIPEINSYQVDLTMRAKLRRD